MSDLQTLANSLKEQIEDDIRYNKSPDKANWSHEIGVLITSNEAQALLNLVQEKLQFESESDRLKLYEVHYHKVPVPGILHRIERRVPITSKGGWVDVARQAITGIQGEEFIARIIYSGSEHKEGDINY